MQPATEPPTEPATPPEPIQWQKPTIIAMLAAIIIMLLIIAIWLLSKPGTNQQLNPSAGKEKKNHFQDGFKTVRTNLFGKWSASVQIACYT